MQNPISRLLKKARQAIRNLELSKKTENAYLNHIRHFLEFGGKHGASKFDTLDARKYLEHLKSNLCLSRATICQARSALMFFYREVLERNIVSLSLAQEKTPPDTLPVILTAEEARLVLSKLRGQTHLAAALMYGAGLRVSEVVRLRVRDLDFQRGEIIVRDACGFRDRTTILPAALTCDLRRQLDEAEYVFEADAISNAVRVYLPKEILAKYPNADAEPGWQFVFPSKKLRKNAEGKPHRGHLAESTVQKAVCKAVSRANIGKNAGCYALRHSFARHLVEQNCDLTRLQTLLGHKNLKTTMIYTHFATYRAKKLVSPLDV